MSDKNKLNLVIVGCIVAIAALTDPVETFAWVGAGAVFSTALSIVAEKFFGE